MNRIILSAASVLALSLLTFGCTHHAYVSLTPGQDLRDVEIPSGNLQLIRNASSSFIVGLAYQKDSDRIFARLIPGTQMLEIERDTGAIIRSFAARQVTPGCGGVSAALGDIAVCGLALRWSDRHFFLDHPNGNPITEVDFNGDFVRRITLQRPSGPIGGLAYDQRTNTIYVLYVTILTVAEVDLNGREIRRFRPQAPIQTWDCPSIRHVGSYISRWSAPLISVYSIWAVRSKPSMLFKTAGLRAVSVRVREGDLRSK